MTGRRLKIFFQFIVPLIISAGLCYILYSDMDWSDVRAGLTGCRWEWIALWAVINIGAMICRAARWRIQLRVIGINPSMPVMARSIFGTYAVNLVFPRLGEVWRCGYVARRERSQFSSVFGSMVADRLSDTASVLLITALSVVLARQAMTRFMAETEFGAKVTSLLGSPWVIGALAALAVIVAIVFMLPGSGIGGRIRSMLHNVWDGFVSIFHMHRAWLWLLLTAGVWAGYFWATWASFLAFDSTTAIFDNHGSVAVLVTFVFGSWAMAVPSNGGIGPWQMAVILALAGIYGMDRGPALAYATIVLALQTLLFIILGFYTFVSIALSRHHSTTPRIHPN